MTDITRVFNVETRSLTNIQRSYCGQIGDSVSTTLHFEYNPIDFLMHDASDPAAEHYVPYIMFSVHDDDGNPLIYGPESTPRFDGYTFPIPWDVTSRATSVRVEYQLYFVKNTVSFDPSRGISILEATQYINSAMDGIALKPSIKCKSKSKCCPTTSPLTEPTVVGWVNYWKQYGLISPVSQSVDDQGRYVITFRTYEGDGDYSVTLDPGSLFDTKVDIHGHTPFTVLAADANGDLVEVGPGQPGQVLTAVEDGTPVWTTPQSSVLSEELVVNKKVGGVDPGTVYPAGTPLEDIIVDMLHSEGPSGEFICKYGASTGIPSSDAGLVQDQTMDWEKLLSPEGWTVTITTQEQYPVVAVSSDVDITSWVVTAFPMVDFVLTGDVVTIDKGTYKLIYLNSVTDDHDLGGTQYTLKFVEA